MGTVGCAPGTPTMVDPNGEFQLYQEFWSAVYLMERTDIWHDDYTDIGGEG